MLLPTLLALTACNGGKESAPPPADMVITGGTIYLSAAETTDALAIQGGVVVAIGDDARARQGADTQAVDLAGKPALPGFHDSHVHLLPGSFVLDRLLMLGTSSMDTILASTADYAAEAPDEPWIVGYGWVHALTDDASGVALDAVVSDRPVLLVDSSGHAALVNSAAMEVVGITADTPDPEGGEIVRDPETGEPTGLLLEEALSLVSDAALAAYDDAAFADGLREALSDLSAAGITSISEIMASPGFDLARPWIYQDLEAAGELPVRIHYYVPLFHPEDVAAAAAFRDLYDGEFVRFSGAKIWVDGSMGTAEAWMSEPLEGEPDNYGSHYFDAAELEAIVREAEALELPLKFHVNGDAAVAATLDALEAVAAEGALRQPHVLEHVVLISEGDRARLASLGLVASVQPSHYLAAPLSDTADAWGEERFDQAYQFGALADSGVPVALGTDWPVWPTLHAPNNLWAAVTARGDDSLTIEEALHAYTANAARGVGREGELGCLAVGCQADLVILSEDPTAVEPADLPGIDVTAVYVAGVRVSD